MSEQFDEQGNSFETDDVEAHRIPTTFDDSGNDTEGHKAGDKAGFALDEDDVEGHLGSIEVDDDVIGHQGLQVQPPRDVDNQGNQF
jgi:hypothetical protein